MKIGQETRKLWHTETPHSLGKHLLTSPHEHSNERADDVITSQFSTHFIYKTDKSLIFQLWECKPCLISTQNKWEIMFILIYFDTRIYMLYLYLKKNENFQNFMYNIYDKLWGDDITNSLIWTFTRTGQETPSEKMRNFKMSQLPHLHPTFITPAPICRKPLLPPPKPRQFWSGPPL